MVACSGVVDGGRSWKGELIMATELQQQQQQQLQQHAMKSARPLVYDVDSGTLRFCKARASLSKSPAHSKPAPLGAADQEQTAADDEHKRLACGAESGESSPTCVIRNSAVRSNSSSPTMSTISKASSDPARKSHEQEARRSHSASSSATTTTTTKSASPESGPDSHKTPPFKSIQSAAADRTLESKKSNHSSSSSGSRSSSSIMHKAPGIFSFNATYVTRVDDDIDEQLAAAVRTRTSSTFLAPLLKPAPSKWDDAEKWVPGSGRSRSGPLLAQMVASQASMLAMPIPSWKPHLLKAHARDPGQGMATSGPSHTTATTSAQSDASDSAHTAAADTAGPDGPHAPNVATDGPHAHTVATDPQGHALAADSARFTTDSTDVIDEKVSQSLVDNDGLSSPSRMNGSFMKLGVKWRNENSTRDTGTAMTPTSVSVQPSPDLRDWSSGRAAEGAEFRARTVAATMTEEEMVAKTRQEIVALGTQLGKASIAAAWAARDQTKERVVERNAAENVSCRDVARANAWKEAATAKLTSRFQQEKAKIAAWEDYEKAKAEAEMLRVEAKAERMRAQAREKLASRVAAAARRGDKQRAAAEARRAEAVAKAARKADLVKRHRSVASLLLLSPFLCT